MFPRPRQRILITIAFAVSTVLWLSIFQMLRASDGSTGIALLEGDFNAVAMKVALVVLAGVGVGTIASITSASGNPMSGVFAASAALTILGAAGGTMQGWFFRHADPGAGAAAAAGSGPGLPGAYRLLMVETLFWTSGLIILLMVIQRLRSPVRMRIPALAFTDHLGMDTHLKFPQSTALLAGLLSAIVGGVLMHVLARYVDTGQVIGSLLIAFTLAGLTAQLVFPQTNPVGILLSPALVAAVNYGLVMSRYPDTATFMSSFNHLALPGGALALPIHYAAAGVAGCALGIGWAQTMVIASAEPVRPEA